MITQQLLKDLFDYDPTTGHLIRKKTNQRAGTMGTYGYRYLQIDHKLYYEHRIIWFWLYGTWPQAQIDHINGIRDDNSLANLRESTHAENAQNIKVSKRNRSGSRIPGVYFNSKRNLYIVLLAKDRKRHFGGTFKTLLEAEIKCFYLRKMLFPFDNCERFLFA